MSTKNLGSEGFKWFLGIIEDLDDPLMLGRVRVRIFEEHDDNIDTKSLPWAISIMPVTSASSGAVGSSPTGLTLGSYAIGFYMDGAEKQFPAIFGTWHKIPGMNYDKHDVSKLARGIQSIQKDKLGPEPASDYAAKYPHNKVTETVSGHVIEIDDTPGAERIHIYHKSGAYIEMNQDGQVVIKSTASNYEIVQDDKTLYAKGKIDFISEKNATINAKVGVKLSAPAGLTVTEGTVTIKGGLSVGTGATGTFTTPTGKTIHVMSGIVTNIF